MAEWREVTSECWPQAQEPASPQQQSWNPWGLCEGTQGGLGDRHAAAHAFPFPSSVNSRAVPSTRLRRPDLVTPRLCLSSGGRQPVVGLDGHLDPRLPQTAGTPCEDSGRETQPRVPAGGKPPCWGRSSRSPSSRLAQGPRLRGQSVRSGSCGAALKRLMSICLPMLMCRGDVSGSRGEGSRQSSGARRRQRLRRAARGETPFWAARLRLQDKAGRWALEAAAACVGGRAPAGWTWKPHCWPLAPMPATPRLARTTSPRPVSRV